MIFSIRFVIINHPLAHRRPTNKPSDQQKNGKLEVGIADDQAKDFDFEKTEMKYDSTGMFHWTPARSIEDCILVGMLSVITQMNILDIPELTFRISLYVNMDLCAKKKLLCMTECINNPMFSLNIGITKRSIRNVSSTISDF